MLNEQEDLIYSYCDGIYHSILIKDVATYLGIADVSVLSSITKFLFPNICNPVSVKKNADAINSSGRNISVNTVDKYLQALCNSYLFYKAKRYDIRRKQNLKTQAKYYCVGSGLRELLLSSSTPDLVHVSENIVYFYQIPHTANYNGIRQLHIVDWLLDKNK